jgi:nucleoid-associated protein YgaU
VLGRPATVDEVVAYWRSVIEANRERLQSGDPDLIYPGEVVLLPASG